ncbi:probable acyl-CoA dehydrogenase 6 [Saccostrea cucullata]|uniref:probable acyl-CoA dehydrogenase 6 n=1 Tax=Saccostrea cuccullata TaxID=36930 RepID=UPI002ECFC7FD
MSTKSLSKLLRRNFAAISRHGIRLSSTQAQKKNKNECSGGIFSEEHQQLRDSLRKIIDKEINPHVDQWEQEGQFPAKKVFKTLGNAGLLGVTKPTEYGGLGLDYTYSIALAEELGNINCGGVPMAIGVQTDMSTPALAKFGSDKMKREFLAPSIAGDVVSCIGVSEVGGGSDVASVKTTAVKSGGDYIINGGKMWITNGAQADWMCLLANTSEGPAHRNKSLICLPMNLPGRDFRLLSIGGGADEVMLSIICKYMNTLPLPPSKQK